MIGFEWKLISCSNFSCWNKSAKKRWFKLIFVDFLLYWLQTQRWQPNRRVGTNYRRPNFNSYRIWHYVSGFVISLFCRRRRRRRRHFYSNWTKLCQWVSILLSDWFCDSLPFLPHHSTDSTKKLQDVLHDFCATDASHKFHPDGVSTTQFSYICFSFTSNSNMIYGNSLSWMRSS